MEDEIKFEKALENLEKIVDDLESGDLSLDEALKCYEEGVKLSRVCTKKLGDSEKKIEMLTRSLEGVADFSDESTETTQVKKTEKKKSKKTAKNSTEDEFLI